MYILSTREHSCQEISVFTFRLPRKVKNIHFQKSANNFFLFSETSKASLQEKTKVPRDGRFGIRSFYKYFACAVF